MYVKGSYTVEATLIFPFVILIIISFVYLGFYLHDLGKVNTIVDEAQIRSKALVRNEVNPYSGIQSYSKYIGKSIFYPIDNDFKRKESQISNYIYEKSADKLFISKVNNVNVDVGAFNIKIEVNIDFTFPFQLLEIFFIGRQNVVIHNEETIHNPMDFIRAWEVSHRVSSQIDISQIVGNLKKKIENLK